VRFVGQRDSAGLPSGLGTAHFDKGSYRGEWRCGMFHGRGELTLRDGSRYSGDFVAGKKHGIGKYNYPTGRVFFGTFAEGKIEGEGIISFPNGGGVYHGEVQEAVRHGEGHMLFGDGAVYLGSWKADRMHGRGRFFAPDGTLEEGSWVQGRKAGIIHLTKPASGSVYRQTYDDDGKLIGEEKIKVGQGFLDRVMGDARYVPEKPPHPRPFRDPALRLQTESPRGRTFNGSIGSGDSSNNERPSSTGATLGNRSKKGPPRPSTAPECPPESPRKRRAPRVVKAATDDAAVTYAGPSGGSSSLTAPTSADPASPASPRKRAASAKTRRVVPLVAADCTVSTISTSGADKGVNEVSNSSIATVVAASPRAKQSSSASPRNRSASLSASPRGSKALANSAFSDASRPPADIAVVNLDLLDDDDDLLPGSPRWQS
jgi:hypothetical protein